ncbi:MAG: SH3 domain-containing protein, partial [Anaerolineae bacterium]|nr:SH3 domain-containing protein [Anaerolineae bacterium]
VAEAGSQGVMGGKPMTDDFRDGEFWDGEEEEGYFEKDRFPRVWLLSMGILSVILVMGVVALAFLALFRPTPSPTPVLSEVEGPVLSPSTSLGINSAEGPVLPSPTSVPLPEGETEAEAIPTQVMAQDTPFLPPPTPTLVPAVPAEITIGIYVKVSGTGGSDLSFRAGPSANHARLKIVAEGAVLKVLDGPVEADGYVWWQLQDVSDGVVGWAAADYLEPTVP